MRTDSRKIEIYTVVQVCSGVAVEAKSFRTLRAARTYLRYLRLEHDEERDDVQLFSNAV